MAALRLGEQDKRNKSLRIGWEVLQAIHCVVQTGKILLHQYKSEQNIQNFKDQLAAWVF